MRFNYTQRTRNRTNRIRARIQAPRSDRYNRKPRYDKKAKYKRKLLYFKNKGRKTKKYYNKRKRRYY